ncbi:hypothetical protein [Niveispirillum sp. BGYR6]|uniref:hypothetical protein n=1 Tax=Niveispirillum sp. BGYR6 TaxID=2971249 RepID=UPI0022B9477E|nr:hypothetical protein [Niveispirillum sp. BGYR6]MDG5495946.1 hypothetical protein [Niveispirillum sp. BGYR6]
MRFLLSAVVTVMAVTAAIAQPGGGSGGTAACAVDTEKMMQLAPEAFDQDKEGGWRPLAARTGCEKATANLINTYIERNWGRIPQGLIHLMYWHAGQMEARAGDYRLAIPLMMAGVAPTQRTQEMGFHEYAQGTIAFLNRDLAGLRAARQRLASLPEPAWFKEEFKEAPSIKWPANLNVLDGFIRCFDAPYATAYGNSCPQAKAAPSR